MHPELEKVVLSNYSYFWFARSTNIATKRNCSTSEVTRNGEEPFFEAQGRTGLRGLQPALELVVGVSLRLLD